MRHKQAKVLVVILILGCVLRVATVLWGVPFFDKHNKINHPDEPKIVQSAIMFPPKMMGSPHPTLYHNFLGVMTLPVKILYFAFFPDKPDQLYGSVQLATRCITIVIGLLGIVLVYSLSKKMYDHEHGILAALILCVCAAHIFYSRLALTYVPLSTAILLGFYYLFYKHKQDIKSTLVLGVITGIILSLKFTGWLFLIPLILYMLSEKDVLIKKKIVNILLVLFVGGMVFSITSPLMFFKNIRMWIAVEHTEVTRLPAFSLFSYELWTENFKSLIFDVGKGLGIFFVCMIFVPLKKNKKEIALIIFAMAILLYFRRGLVARYWIPILPILAILSVHGFKTVLLKVKNLFVKKILWVVFFCVIVHATAYSLTGIWTCYNDTRKTASKYIENQYPDKTRIAYLIVNMFGEIRGFPSVDITKYDIVNAFDNPDIIIVSSKESDKILKAIKNKELLENYSVKKEDAYKWYKSSPPPAILFEFHDKLINKETLPYKKTKEFIASSDTSIDFPPPTIIIYEKTLTE